MFATMRNRSRQRLAGLEPLEAILSRAGENRFARINPPVPTKLWREAVGPRIAERARPVWLHAGMLVLRVTSSVWAHELSLLAEEICGRLRQFGIDAKTLRFRVGPLPALERPPERRVARSVPTERTIPPELARALSRIDDEGLRSAIGRAAAANLAWQSVVRAAPEDVTEARRAARAPRSAEEGTSPPDRASPVVREGGPRTRAGEAGRSR
jgi:hypothetical protein